MQGIAGGTSQSQSGLSEIRPRILKDAAPASMGKCKSAIHGAE
jgi:hypothetical protein